MDINLALGYTCYVLDTHMDGIEIHSLFLHLVNLSHEVCWCQI